MEMEDGGAAEIQDSVVPTRLHATCCSHWVMGQVMEKYGMPVSHMIFPKLDVLTLLGKPNDHGAETGAKILFHTYRSHHQSGPRFLQTLHFQ